MKKHLIVSGIVFVLLVVGFSGCIGTFQDIIIDDFLYQNAPRDPLTINNIQLPSILK